ncbi:MAG: hypothetical protein JNL70_16925 [Saprospiraceae bacterium]|nr:hypothetical protein [Saprospiraceae bacterium]
MGAEIKNRTDLQNLFQEGAVPTASDFRSLFDSILVKKDDRFFGMWSEKNSYTEGDVVLFKDIDKKVGIYVFTGKKPDTEDRDCDCTDDCGKTPPNKCCCWQLIHLDIDDGDWQIVKDTPNLMYAKVYGRIGVGTNQPTAFLHLNDGTEGAGSQYLFNPEGTKKKAHLKVINSYKKDDESSLLPNPTELSQILDNDIVSWLTNTPLGFVFKKTASLQTKSKSELGGEMGHHIEKGHSQISKYEDTVLLLINNDSKNQPLIGIGTSAPKTTLDARNEIAENAITLDVSDKMPQLTLIKMTENGDVKVVENIDSQFVTWTTNTALGYLFKDEDKRLTVSFSAEGNVGIGTETPQSKLEIVDKKGQLSFDATDGPASLDIVNNLSNGNKQSFKLASQKNAAVFSSEAPEGFLFQNGRQKTMMSIEPEPDTNNFNQSLQGAINANGFYVRLLTGEDTKELKSGLQLLEKLNPRIGNYEGDDHVQIGFTTTKNMPSEIVREFSDSDKGIAQQNLIAILVKAVKELNDKVISLEKQLNPPTKK